MGFSPRCGPPRVFGAFCLALAMTLSVSGGAQAAPKTSEAKTVESARSQFYRALALQDQGRWAEALEILERVAETRESAQVRFNIAFNQEHLGRLATAARGYERAIALAGQSGAENVVRAANDRLGGISPRIARLVLRPVVLVDAAPSGDGVSVRLDGVELAARDWGRAVPVEVGDHTIVVEAAGYERYRASVTLPGGETRELVIELEPAHEERPTEIALPRPLPKNLERAPAPLPKPPPEPAQQQPTSKSSPLPYIAGGAAVLSVATAVVFYALRKDALDTMHAGCENGHCPDDLRSTDERGALYTTIANAALATGVGLGGVSAGLFIAEVGDGNETRRAVGVRASVSTAF
jgi:hypothetical protein